MLPPNKTPRIILPLENSKPLRAPAASIAAPVGLGFTLLGGERLESLITLLLCTVLIRAPQLIAGFFQFRMSD